MVLSVLVESYHDSRFGVLNGRSKNVGCKKANDETIQCDNV